MKPEKYIELKNIVQQIRDRGACFVKTKFNVEELQKTGLGTLVVRCGKTSKLYIANPTGNKGFVNYIQF